MILSGAKCENERGEKKEVKLKWLLLFTLIIWLVEIEMEQKRKKKQIEDIEIS